MWIYHSSVALGHCECSARTPVGAECQIGQALPAAFIRRRGRGGGAPGSHNLWFRLCVGVPAPIDSPNFDILLSHNSRVPLMKLHPMLRFSFLSLVLFPLLPQIPPISLVPPDSVGCVGCFNSFTSLNLLVPFIFGSPWSRNSLHSYDLLQMWTWTWVPSFHHV